MYEKCVIYDKEFRWGFHVLEGRMDFHEMSKLFS